MRPLRIALFHASLPSPRRKIGGVEAAVHHLASTLAADRSVEVTVLSCGEPPAGAAYCHKQVFPFALGNRLLRLFVLPALLNFVDFRDFDVVHTHGDDWFWLWRRVPTIRTMHGSALREAQSATTLKRRLLQYMIYPLERLSAWLATRSVAVGTDTRQLYSCDELVGNSVCLNRFKPRQKANFPLLVFIGIWNGRKRGNFAFRTFVDCVLPNFPDAQLHMVSDVADKHPSVIWHRYLDDDALGELLARAWVFCYPSTYEGFGIPYIEAMASGTAVVTTKNSGARDVLADGEFGLICEDAEFGERLVDALANADLRQLLVAKGIERARKFSDDVVASLYLQIYREVARC